MKSFLLILSFVLISSTMPQTDSVFVCQDGNVDFVSEAPLEVISASSNKLSGVLDVFTRNFSFKIPSRSFQGFNSSLQRTHFNEDYMESELYPNSTFKGKIIEEVDLDRPGRYTVRAKGKLYIHGEEFDRIIRCTLDVSEQKIDVSSQFTVFLEDHNITIPSIVNKKIAEEIKVKIDLSLKTR